MSAVLLAVVYLAAILTVGCFLLTVAVLAAAILEGDDRGEWPALDEWTEHCATTPGLLDMSPEEMAAFEADFARDLPVIDISEEQ